ncbi:MAG: hypothetical protein BWK73_20145 [Thiothrix lacustris]|uniref:Uncharacterized protein n=1 Tax=Thiothrix lacustris TaxID=525917 RepID=A0A1Y1QP58_9GAMM|nr:MAG: hypothetical protein BWK73_20145 [Thiothrix lacustris]
MCTQSDIIDHILGERVNDELEAGDYLVWSRPVVAKVLRECLSAIYGFRPDLFAETRTVTLQRSSCLQSLCKDCAKIINIISVDGNSCNKIEEHKDENDDKSLDWMSCYFKDCNPPNKYWECNAGYDPGDWQPVDGSPCTVRFKNPTPSDRDVTATVACVPPDALTRDTLPAAICDEMFTAVVDHALFRLYSIDHKDGNNLELADKHWRAYTTFMATKFDVDFALLENNMVLTKRRIDR